MRTAFAPSILDADLAFAQHLVGDRRALFGDAPDRSSCGPQRIALRIPALAVSRRNAASRSRDSVSGFASARSGHDRHPERVHLARHREVLQLLVVRRLRARRRPCARESESRSSHHSQVACRASAAAGAGRLARALDGDADRRRPGRRRREQARRPRRRIRPSCAGRRRRRRTGRPAAARTPASAGSRSAAGTRAPPPAAARRRRSGRRNARAISGTITARSSVSLYRIGSSVNSSSVWPARRGERVEILRPHLGVAVRREELRDQRIRAARSAPRRSAWDAGGVIGVFPLRCAGSCGSRVDEIGEVARRRSVSPGEHRLERVERGGRLRGLVGASSCAPRSPGRRGSRCRRADRRQAACRSARAGRGLRRRRSRAPRSRSASGCRRTSSVAPARQGARASTRGSPMRQASAADGRPDS